jgi:hypothetical protein
VTPPASFNDPSFIAFRKQLGDVAAHKDRAALAKLVVAQNFFWIQDKDLADKRKPASTISPRRSISTPRTDRAGTCSPATPPSRRRRNCRRQKGVFCAPADPAVDPADSKRSARPPGPTRPIGAIRPRTASKCAPPPQPNSPVVEKLGLILVRVLPDSAPPDDANEPPFLHIATPSGKAGFVDA